MPKSTTTRRSKRLAVRQQPTKPRPDARKESTTSASFVDLDALDAKIKRSTPIKKKKSKRITVTIKYVADSASDFSTDNEDSEEDEYGESANLSADNFEWHSADDIDSSRHNSYDIRCDSVNEDHEMDDFIVGDDEEIEEMSSSDDDSDDEVSNSIRRISVLSELSAIVVEETRRSSSESSASKLFFSDPEDQVMEDVSWMDFAVANDGLFDVEDAGPLLTEPSADLVEEILDALAVFSRRCNRNRKPVKLRLGSAVMKDGEVREALDNAARLGLGRKVSLADGSKRWVIGPKEG
jgi:hypothetical protein